MYYCANMLALRSCMLPAWILAGCLVGIPAEAQTTTQVNLNMTVDYVSGETEETYTGSGTLTPFGSATLQGVATFQGSTAQASFTVTVANGDSFQASVNSSSVTIGPTVCSFPLNIAGGTGAFANATGSVTVAYDCSPSLDTLSGSVQITGSGSITTAPPPGGGMFSVSPSALTFSFLEGGRSSSQRITLTNRTTQAAAFTASAGTESWLSASPANGNVPSLEIASVSVTVDPSGLAPGTYTSTVTVSGPTGQPLEVSINVTVNAAPLALALSQTSLRFQVAAGAGAPPSQSIVVLNQGTSTLTWSASASSLVGNWLSVTPARGTSGDSATVAIDPTNLQPGDYYGLVQFTSDGAVNSPQTAVVVLNVLPATSVVVTVQPTGLIFVSPQGGGPTTAPIVTVSNSSNQSVVVTAIGASQQTSLFAPGLSNATVSSGQPAQFPVDPDFTGLTPGVYTGILEFQFADGSIQDVTVLVIITPPASSAAPRTSVHGAAVSSSCTPTQLLPVSTALSQNFNAIAAWPTALQIHVVDDCGSPMGPGDVTASFSSGDPSLMLTSLGAGQWSATWQPQFATDSTSVVITVTAQSSQPTLAGTLQINGTLQPNQTAPSIGGVVSAASYARNAPLAPGAFTSIFGENLATTPALAEALPLGTQLGGAQALIAGRLMPVQYASAGQLNVLIPYDLPPNSTQQLIAVAGSAYSTPQPITIAPAQPAVFTHGEGVGAITVYKPNGGQYSADASHPASAGDTLVIYCAGLGSVTPSVTAGSAAPASPPAKISTAITVTIGGKTAPVVFAGLTPTYAGLYQVNVTVPRGITPGPNVPLVLTADGLASPPVTIAIQ